MEPVTVSILGLGAEGSIAFRALAGKPCRVRILAKGERAQRLRAEGITINGTHYDLTVSEPGAEPPPKLLIVAVKSYQLSGALEDAAAECGQDTVVMSLMNGLTSEEVLARRIGGEHLIYCMSRINAKKSGPNVEFQPVGAIYIGEKDGSVTDRIREIHALLDGDVSCCICWTSGGNTCSTPPSTRWNPFCGAATGGSNSCRRPTPPWNASWRRSSGWPTPAA